MLQRFAQAAGLRSALRAAQGAERAGSHAACSTSFAAGALASQQGAAGGTTPSFASLVLARFKSSTASSSPGLKTYKPTTPGFRGRVTTSRKDLWKGGPFKPLTEGLRRSGGRDSRGRVSSRHIGGGARKVYRQIDFRRGAGSPAGTVERVEYDPNRTARIALLKLDEDEVRKGEEGAPRAQVPLREQYAYVLAAAGVEPGVVLRAGPEAPVTAGNVLALADIPVGMPIHNVELVPGRGGQLARAAGAAASVVKKADDGYATVRLPSGEQRLVPLACHATLGTLGNAQHKNRKLGKAGATRWAGRRPRVRGVAMNACDHPHGGGRGKSKGTQSQTPWGMPTKGYRTRKAGGRTDWAIVLSRHKAKKRA